MYEYACRVTRVIDGDSLVAVIDVGFQLSYTAKIRLAGINAPERSAGEPWAKSKAMLADLLLDKPGVTVTTIKGKEFEKYGRVLGTFMVGGVDANVWMVAGGYAVESTG